MRRLACLSFLLLVVLAIALQAQTPVRYGANPAAGNTFTHDGIRLYYEIYGSGDPILLVHGDGLSIASFKAQIEYFRQHYRVIAMDSRDQGRSGESADAITYEKMTDDLAALLDHLKSEPVYVLGWSDGGIEALLLALRHPEKVKKIAAMAANLDPQGIRPEFLDWIRNTANSMPAQVKTTSQGKREAKLLKMMLTEPHIDPGMLERITAPTLILAGDHDAIRDEHTLEIFHHLPNSELCIFPGATHVFPYDDPAVFNAVVDRFFRTPFVKKDRLNEVLKSLGEIEKNQ